MDDALPPWTMRGLPLAEAGLIAGNYKGELHDAARLDQAPQSRDLSLHLTSELVGHRLKANRRPPSPRYMQATRSSAALSAVESAEVDISDMHPAGGAQTLDEKSMIDMEPEPQRRPLRRPLAAAAPRRSTAATTANIAAPTRGATLESPRALSDARLLEAGMFAEAGGGCGARPPRAPAARSVDYYSTHDKSIPNSPQ